MKPLDGDGRELDSIFSVETSGEEVFMILESRGGGVGGPRPPRNADYAPAMELLLQRLGAHGAILVDVEVFSGVTRNWPAKDRQILAPSFPLPIELASFTKFQKFRLEIGRASAALGRKSGQGAGNRTKRLRFSLHWPSAKGKSSNELERQLADRVSDSRSSKTHATLRYEKLGDFLRTRREPALRLGLNRISEIIEGPLPADARTSQFWSNATAYHQTRRGQWLNAGYKAFFEPKAEAVLFRRDGAESISTSWTSEMPTSDPDELAIRVASAKRRIEEASGGLPPPPPGSSGKRTKQSEVKRFIRDPNVIAWVLIVAQGHCEACSNPAPFLRDDGEPFLEVHHVRPLGQGGPDRTDNAVAICPNCHRKLHFSAHRTTFRADVIRKVGRLVDYPPSPIEDEENP